MRIKVETAGEASLALQPKSSTHMQRGDPGPERQGGGLAQVIRVWIWPPRSRDGVGGGEGLRGTSPPAEGQGCVVQLTLRPLRHMQIWQG